MAKKLEILIVCANFYEEITDNLLEGVKNALKGEKVTYEIITCLLYTSPSPRD